MVHIILAILRIIGIILLIVLGIAAALILLVLFWPVEYQIHLRKEDQPFEAEGRAGWLFHLLSADVQIRERTGTITLKVFGRRLKTFRIPEGRKAEKPRSQKASRTETVTRPGRRRRKRAVRQLQKRGRRHGRFRQADRHPGRRALPGRRRNRAEKQLQLESVLEDGPAGSGEPSALPFQRPETSLQGCPGQQRGSPQGQFRKPRRDWSQRWCLPFGCRNCLLISETSLTHSMIMWMQRSDHSGEKQVHSFHRKRSVFTEGS